MQSRLELGAVRRVGLGPHGVEDRAEEAAGGRRQRHVQDAVVWPAARSQGRDVGRGHRRRIRRDLRGEIHHRHVGLAETGPPVVGDQAGDRVRVVEAVAQHLAVRQRAVAGPQRARRGQRGELVLARVQIGPDGLAELPPRLVHRRAKGEQPGEVGDVAEGLLIRREHLGGLPVDVLHIRQLDERHCGSPRVSS